MLSCVKHVCPALVSQSAFTPRKSITKTIPLMTMNLNLITIGMRKYISQYAYWFSKVPPIINSVPSTYELLWSWDGLLLGRLAELLPSMWIIWECLDTNYKILRYTKLSNQCKGGTFNGNLWKFESIFDHFRNKKCVWRDVVKEVGFSSSIPWFRWEQKKVYGLNFLPNSLCHLVCQERSYLQQQSDLS